MSIEIEPTNITKSTITIDSNILMGTDDTDGSSVPLNMTTFEISARHPKLDHGYALDIDISQSRSVIKQSHADDPHSASTDSAPSTQQTDAEPYAYPTILKMVVNATKNNPFDSDDDSTGSQGTNDASGSNNQSSTPTMDDTLDKAWQDHGIKLDDKQLLAYQMVCATFMSKILRNQLESLTLSDRSQQHIEQTNRRLWTCYDQ